MNERVLVVRNVEQAAIWLELDGQLSDGMWENTRPLDHWKPWCDARVVVGKNVGRNFSARKDNYNFSSKELLDVVGKRMLGVVRIARGVGLKAADILEHAVDCDSGRIDWSAGWNGKNLITKLEAIGVTTDSVDLALANDSYGMSDMRRDLNDLKAIIKERNNRMVL